MVLICIPLTTNDAEHFSCACWHWCIIFREMSTHVFSSFFNQEVLLSLHILDTRPASDM